MNRELKIIAFLAFIILINPLILIPSIYRIWTMAILGGLILFISLLILYKETEPYQEDAFVESEPNDDVETESRHEESFKDSKLNINENNDE